MKIRLKEKNSFRLLPIINIFIYFALGPLQSNAKIDGLGVVLLPGETKCFYEDVMSSTPSEREVQVFVQQGGDLDIILAIQGPFQKDERGHPRLEHKDTKPFIYKERVKSGVLNDMDFGDNFKHKFMARDGVYEICLENHRQLGQSTKILQMYVGEPQIAPGFDKDHPSAVHDKKIQDAALKLNLPDKMHSYATHLATVMESIEVIKEKQEKERHRLAVHSALNVSSHNKMVLSSIVETAVFVLASFFQIFFIRRWFAGKGLKKQWA